MSSLATYWPKKALTALQKNKIIQIQYSVKNSTKGLVDITAINTFESSPKPYDVTKMPLSYEEHLRRVFYRLELLSACAEWKGDSQITNVISSNLGYLDKIIVAMEDEAEAAALVEKEEEYNLDWRCGVFDAWLSIEGRVGRHDPESVSQYIKEGGEELSSDAFEIGPLFPFSSSFFSFFSPYIY
jgi:hypothetical protein